MGKEGVGFTNKCLANCSLLLQAHGALSLSAPSSGGGFAARPLSLGKANEIRVWLAPWALIPPSLPSHQFIQLTNIESIIEFVSNYMLNNSPCTKKSPDLL